MVRLLGRRIFNELLLFMRCAGESAIGRDIVATSTPVGKQKQHQNGERNFHRKSIAVVRFCFASEHAEVA